MIPCYGCVMSTGPVILYGDGEEDTIITEDDNSSEEKALQTNARDSPSASQITMRHIVREIIQTEQSYVHDINMLIQVRGRLKPQFNSFYLSPSTHSSQWL